jgi:hypothetical protein
VFLQTVSELYGQQLLLLLLVVVVVVGLPPPPLSIKFRDWFNISASVNIGQSREKVIFRDPVSELYRQLLLYYLLLVVVVVLPPPHLSIKFRDWFNISASVNIGQSREKVIFRDSVSELYRQLLLYYLLLVVVVVLPPPPLSIKFRDWFNISASVNIGQSREKMIFRDSVSELYRQLLL